MDGRSYTLDDFDFNLPEELIAQRPTEARDESRLFVLKRNTGEFIHTYFCSLADYIIPGDLLIFNDAKVIPARIIMEKATGAMIELLLLEHVSAGIWAAICNRMKRIRKGDILVPVRDRSISCIVKDKQGDRILVEFIPSVDQSELDRIGDMALPPYIRRPAEDNDRLRYQTVYAKSGAAIAAPTAGLHFTPVVLEAIRDRGASFDFVTLNVSWGTFQPVRNRRIEDHVIHSEDYMLEHSVAERINRSRESGGRIIAVGTTSLRVLESTYSGGINTASAGKTDLYIYPPKKVCSTDALITNFHTPKSTLLMLVAAFAGYDTIMRAYETAVSMKYRFFSYGDAMLII